MALGVVGKLDADLSCGFHESGVSDADVIRNRGYTLLVGHSVTTTPHKPY